MKPYDFQILLDKEQLMPEKVYPDLLSNTRTVRTKMGWLIEMRDDLRQNPMEQYAEEIGKRIREHENFPAYKEPIESWPDEVDDDATTEADRT